MYGILLDNIQHFIIDQYGENAWHEILQHAKLPFFETFNVHSIYSDKIMPALAKACAEVLLDRTREEYMMQFGKCFVQFFSSYGYDSIVRASGRRYIDFLNGIDNLHEMTRFNFPKLQTPSFCVDNITKEGCQLHYRTKRTGFTYYVMGQLKEVASKFYYMPVTIRVVEEKPLPQGVHVIYDLAFDNSDSEMDRKKCIVKDRAYSHISEKTFFEVRNHKIFEVILKL